MRFFYPTALLLCTLTSATWASNSNNSPDEAQPAQPKHPSRVLVVDDNKVSAMIPAVFIRKKSVGLGIPVEVQISLHPLDALAKAGEQLSKNEPFDVVVTDHDMGKNVMNGLEMARQMRKMSLEKSQEGESPRFILNTANETVALGGDPIFEAVFQKNPTEVAEKVMELVSAGTPRKKTLPENKANFNGGNMESN